MLTTPARPGVDPADGTIRLGSALKAAGIALPEWQPHANGSVSLGTVTGESAAALARVLREGLAKECAAANAVRDAARAAGLKMEPPLVFGRRVHVGVIDIETAQRLDALLRPADMGQEAAEEPEEVADRLITLLREVTAGGFLDAAFYGCCPRCGGDRLRDAHASQAASPTGLMMRAIRAIKDTAPEMAVMTETCVCSHTDTGECFIAGPWGRGLDLVSTIEALAEQAVAQAAAGADIVGPAAMMPGSVRAVRTALDAAGHEDVSIMPHLIFDSALYEGYRATMGAAPVSGSRAFQIIPRQAEQAIRTGLDYIGEGADMLLLEPALFAVDLLVRLKAATPVPLVPFSVSGEYLRLTSQAEDGTRESRLLSEAFTMLKRAGAERIVTYGAMDLARAAMRG
ncbi:hypothetical protein ACWD4K_26980 [Streptomyces gelaticus]